MPEVNLMQGDCLERLKELDDESVDSIVTDPPYGLGFMNKDWDMQTPSVEIFQECLRVIKPGGHLLAFGGSRTYHRLACAVEDAGFDIRDQIMWVYGSGFPKSQNVSKFIEKKTQQTEEAQQWEGWGTALKPSHEPIVMARKPLKGTVADNVMEYGTGAINIDNCRIETEENPNGGAYSENGNCSVSQSLNNNGMNQPGKTANGEYTQLSGRFPANLIHDGSDEVEEEFKKYGNRKSGAVKEGIVQGFSDKGNNIYGESDGVTTERKSSEGSASRFFYCAKANKKDRGEGNTHPTVKPTSLMEYLVRLVTPKEGTVLDPFMGSGSTGKACMNEGFHFIGVELGEIETAEKRINEAKTEKESRLI